MKKIPKVQPATADRDLESQLREMNGALLISSVRQHELAENARQSEAALRETNAEIESRSEELIRFNRVSVGRELRMLDLKKEINALYQRLGKTAPYPLDFEPADETIQAESRIAFPSHSPVPLEAILRTEELHRRPARRPDYETEGRALSALAQSLADSPGMTLQKLADTILEAFQVGSAGISLLTNDKKRFYWPAIAGIWQTHIGGGTPRDFGPCGDVLDRNAPLLFTHVERRYTYFLPVEPAVEECLLVPFYVAGKAVGTVWVVAHDDRRTFDAEDLRQLQSMGRFASAAYQAVNAMGALGQRRDAALNLMEDAVQSRQAIEKVNRELRESEERFRTLFDAAPMAVFVCDRNSVIQQYNARAMELWARQPTCGVERHCGSPKLYSPDGTPLPHDQSPIVDVLRTGVPAFNVEMCIERPDGSRVSVLANFAPRKNAGGEITGAIASFIDITERSLLEQKTKEQAKALVDLHHRKDEFLAMLSHELRNPLAPITNALQLLRLRKNKDRLQQQAYTIIERQVGQLARLVDDLLEVSRITTGRIHVQQERVDLNGIVQHGVETVRTLINQRQHAFRLSLPTQPVWLYADGSRLEQVVMNLLTNAAKYTADAGDISLVVEQEGGDAVLRVRDTGVGIAPELLPRIFDLFTQAEQSLDRSQGGLGIGLCLVQRLVEMHGGSVEANSALGQGSEFIVRLPLMAASEPDLLSTDELSAETTGRSLRVLVVDDNVDAARTLGMLLQASGHDVRTVYDGLTVLGAALDFRPNVVLLDIGLPGLDGFEVAKLLRKQPVLGSVVLVAMTGYGQGADRQRSLEAGFNHHLVKPADFRKVQRILATIPETAT